jgi:hypothetical protein
MLSNVMKQIVYQYFSFKKHKKKREKNSLGMSQCVIEKNSLFSFGCDEAGVFGTIRKRALGELH